jgi:hypothetical protein
VVTEESENICLTEEPDDSGDESARVSSLMKAQNKLMKALNFTATGESGLSPKKGRKQI